MPLSDRAKEDALVVAEGLSADSGVWWHMLSELERDAISLLIGTFDSIANGRRDHLNSE